MEPAQVFALLDLVQHLGWVAFLAGMAGGICGVGLLAMLKAAFSGGVRVRPGHNTEWLR